MKDFSIIIPTKELILEKIKALPAINNLDYPKKNIEVIIVEGNQPAYQRNYAAKLAKGRFLLFLDDDSQPSKDLLKNIINFFIKDNNLTGVGGPALSINKNILQWALEGIFSSKFGTYSTCFRFKKHKTIINDATEKSLILCNLCIKKDIFLKEGGLNEELYPNEENEFLYRLRKKKYRFIYSPEVIVYKEHRENIKGFIKQVINYGRGRIEQLAITKGFKEDIMHFVPLIFTLYLLFLFINLFFSVSRHVLFILFIPLFIYIILSLIASVKIIKNKIKNKNKKLAILFILFPALFFLLHICYGIGTMWGILRVIFKLKKPNKRPQIRRVEVISYAE